LKVCVIGAGGFVGQRIATLLSKDSDINALTLLDTQDFKAPMGAEKVVGDFSDSHTRDSAIKDADAVIHLAAILGGAAEQEYSAARKINVEATLDLAEACSVQNAKTRFVFASTIAVLASDLPDPVTDLAPTAPTLVYGAQKLMLEVALSNFAKTNRLDAVSIRPSGVMARDGGDAALKTAFMSRLFWNVQRGDDIVLPVEASSQTWMTSIECVAQNFIHAAKTPDLGQNRAFTLPATCLTFGALVDALRRRFPDSKAQISFEPDPEIIDLFGSFPSLKTEVADALGFQRDADADALVLNSF